MLNTFKRTINPLIFYCGKRKIERHFSSVPLLIGGCGRSGTTLLLSILSAHPSIYAFGYELSLFNHWIKDEKTGKIIPERLDRFYRYVILRKIPPEAELWCEKTPRNVLFLKEIFEYFNNNVKIFEYFF